MFKYELIEPAYQTFPYERSLASEELAALTGGRRVNGHFVHVGDPVGPDILRRIAFASKVRGDGDAVVSDVSMLEEATLRLRDGRGKRKESNYLTHGLHSFKGKFYPQLARALLNTANVGPGDLVLDPFSGSGTSLVEASLLGIDAVGFDVSPLATLIASTKVALLDVPAHQLDGCIDAFERQLIGAARREGITWRGSGSDEPAGRPDYDALHLARLSGTPEAVRELDSWFPGSVRHKLAIILRAVARIDDEVVRDFFRVCLSDLVRSSSQQDPRDLRIRRRTESIQDAPILGELVRKARIEARKLQVGQPLINQYPWPRPAVRAELRDSRLVDLSAHPLLGRRKVDAVVTSPPYATALPYVDTDRLSFLVLGLLTRAERKQLEREMIGSREIADRERVRVEEEMERGGLSRLPDSLADDLRIVLETNRLHDVGFRKRNTAALLYRYFVDMRAALGNIAQAVRSGGEAYLVLGDSKTVLGDGRTFAIQTCQHVAGLAEQVGFRWERSVPITVTTQNLAHAKNAITLNQVLILRRQ